jgi:hypothetical protein
MVVVEVFQRVGIPGIVGTPLLWKTSIYHYSVVSVVFDNTNDVAHPVSKQFEQQCFSLQGEFLDDGGATIEICRIMD